MPNVPDIFKYSTPDTIAECVDGITDETYRELWNVLNNPEFSKRPLGGDGTNGTSEVPDDFSGSLEDAWKFLSDKAKNNIMNCAAENN